MNIIFSAVTIFKMAVIKYAVNLIKLAVIKG